MDTLTPVTEDFLKALNNFAWNTDYSRFCELLELSEDDYSKINYSRFCELISLINTFDAKTITLFLREGGLEVDILD